MPDPHSGRQGSVNDRAGAMLTRLWWPEWDAGTDTADGPRFDIYTPLRRVEIKRSSRNVVFSEMSIVGK